MVDSSSGPSIAPVRIKSSRRVTSRDQRDAWKTPHQKGDRVFKNGMMKWGFVVFVFVCFQIKNEVMFLEIYIFFNGREIVDLNFC